MIGQNGFQALRHGFHPNHNGRPYLGNGGGCHGNNIGRGRGAGRYGGGRPARSGFEGRGGRFGTGGRNDTRGRNDAEGHADRPAFAPAFNQASNVGRGRGDTVAISLNLASQAAALLQQAFTVVQDQGKAMASEQHTPTETHEASGKDKVKIESIKELSKPTSYEKPQSSRQPEEVQGNSKVPYCWRCYTKGHDATLRGMRLLNAYQLCIAPFVTAMTMPKSAVQNGVAKNQLLPLAAMWLKDWVSSKYLMSQPNNRKMTPGQQ
jgi:hypothetical protein